MTCDQEIARVRAAMSPRPRDMPWQFSPESLDALEIDVNLLTNNAFARLKGRAELARASGNQAFGPTKAPPVCAVTHLRAAMANRQINLDGPDGVALGYIQTLRDALHRWREHPHFEAIVSSLCNEFHHTMAALTIASYLSDVGNHIGITKANHQAGRSPDLFVNTGRDERLSIEVKCPQAFFFPAEPPGVEKIARRMEREIKDARGQITGRDGGIVVIGAGHFAPPFHAALKQTLGEVCKRGRVSSRVAAVAVVAFMKPTIGRSPTGEARLNTGSHVLVEQNPRFLGVNPINKGPR